MSKFLIIEEFKEELEIIFLDVVKVFCEVDECKMGSYEELLGILKFFNMFEENF